MCLWTYTNTEGPDQPAHLRSLIRAFVVRESLDAINVSMESNAPMRLCAYTGWCESTHFAHVRRYFSLEPAQIKWALLLSVTWHKVPWLYHLQMFMTGGITFSEKKNGENLLIVQHWDIFTYCTTLRYIYLLYYIEVYLPIVLRWGIFNLLYYIEVHLPIVLHWGTFTYCTTLRYIYLLYYAERKIIGQERENKKKVWKKKMFVKKNKFEPFR